MNAKCSDEESEKNALDECGKKQPEECKVQRGCYTTLEHESKMVVKYVRL